MSSENDSFRSRTWWFLLYPEHLIQDGLISDLSEAQEFIRSKFASALLGSGFISPLHSPDQDDSQDNIRKPHFHIMIKYSSKKSVDQFYDSIVELFPDTYFVYDKRESLKNTSRIHDWNSVARYLIHKDNPEKEQFEHGAGSIAPFGGADPVKDTLNTFEASCLIDDMEEFIKDQCCICYSDFKDYCRTDRPEWSRVLNTNHMAQVAIWQYIKSRNYESRPSKKC